MSPAAASPTPTTLLDLFARVPAERTAVIVPERDLRISYGTLRRPGHQLRPGQLIAGSPVIHVVLDWRALLPPEAG